MDFVPYSGYVNRVGKLEMGDKGYYFTLSLTGTRTVDIEGEHLIGRVLVESQDPKDFYKGQRRSFERHGRKRVEIECDTCSDGDGITLIKNIREIGIEPGKLERIHNRISRFFHRS